MCLEHWTNWWSNLDSCPRAPSVLAFVLDKNLVWIVSYMNPGTLPAVRHTQMWQCTYLCEHSLFVNNSIRCSHALPGVLLASNIFWAFGHLVSRPPGLPATCEAKCMWRYPAACGAIDFTWVQPNGAFHATTSTSRLLLWVLPVALEEWDFAEPFWPPCTGSVEREMFLSMCPIWTSAGTGASRSILLLFSFWDPGIDKILGRKLQEMEQPVHVTPSGAQLDNAAIYSPFFLASFCFSFTLVSWDWRF